VQPRNSLFFRTAEQTKGAGRRPSGSRRPGLEPGLSSVCAALYGVVTLPFWGLASNTVLILNPLVLSVTLACLIYSRGPTKNTSFTERVFS
jgi:hypothetical protein